MLKAKAFQGSKMGLLTAGRSRAVVQQAVDAATDWMNKNEDRIAVRHIAMGHDEVAANVVVWYEEKQDGHGN